MELSRCDWASRCLGLLNGLGRNLRLLMMSRLFKWPLFARSVVNRLLNLLVSWGRWWPRLIWNLLSYCRLLCRLEVMLICRRRRVLRSVVRPLLAGIRLLWCVLLISLGILIGRRWRLLSVRVMRRLRSITGLTCVRELMNVWLLRRLRLEASSTWWNRRLIRS